MKHPNKRYAHPNELSYWRFGMSDKALADHLHRSENTIKNWRTGREKIPFWVPELLRLQHYEYQNRMRLMGIGQEKARLGQVKNNVIEFGLRQIGQTDAHPTRPDRRTAGIKLIGLRDRLSIT